MTRLRLLGGPNSPFVRKVLIALIEKGLLDQVDLVRLSPPATSITVHDMLLTHNPLGKIPVLTVGDGPDLYESDLICEYLEATFPDPALLAVGQERWQTLRWNALGTGALEMLILWRGERLRPAEQRSDATIIAFAAKLKAVLAAMERDLPALAASPFGLGHIAWGCFLGYLDFRFNDLDWRGQWPDGAAWYDAFLERPSAAATLPDPDPAARPHPLRLARQRLTWG
ncbi:hypothetical protein WSK_1452 [Novosphingobium sp. Rr 2-17]|uniref:glutathione S-transferase family protein n=1 Tax=Novosphingobium sp. Rr 2-17 TaxID=555793 RepID=UPI0002698EAC|nr:glutathione S-transferase family protein [Novosphingobium sp. Rr 2-17]EIZ80085.1 hypothetical protein WSK_1452 [Novosphingobium sp. Rr 2-17]